MLVGLSSQLPYPENGPLQIIDAYTYAGIHIYIYSYGPTRCGEGQIFTHPLTFQCDSSFFNSLTLSTISWPWAIWPKVPQIIKTMWKPRGHHRGQHEIRQQSALVRYETHKKTMVYPPKTNMTMENPPWMKMYFLLTMGFQCHVIFQGGNSPIFSNCIWRPLTPRFPSTGSWWPTFDPFLNYQVELPFAASLYPDSHPSLLYLGQSRRQSHTEVRCPHFFEAGRFQKRESPTNGFQTHRKKSNKTYDTCMSCI